MLMFATGTGTRRNLAGMRANGWGLLLTPNRPELLPGFAEIAIDNGAWGAFQRKEKWVPDKFCKLAIKKEAGPILMQRIGLNIRLILIY